jgi:hypothetical protein
VYRFSVFLLLFVGTPGLTTIVYKSVDGNGIVSFSDKPIEDTTPIEVLQVAPPLAQAPEEYLQQLDSMREATDRMASYRAPDPRQSSDYTDYLPRYTGRQDYHPRPAHPAVPLRHDSRVRGLPARSS